MADRAQFLPEIRYVLPYVARDVEAPRVGMMSRHMCDELNGICRYPESYGIRIVGLDATESSLRFRETRQLVPRACHLMKGALVAAGGSVLSMLERESGHSYVLYDPSNGEVAGRSGFASSDVDFYVRANSPEGRRAVVAEVLRNVMPPVGKVVRTQFAISWEAKLSDVYGDWHKYGGGDAVLWRFKGASRASRDKVVKVQIINRTLPRTVDAAADIDHIFATYDLDCCKWAFDDRGLYGTPRALDALVSRICRVPRERISDSLVSRMARYLKRCYDFEIEQDYRTTPPNVRIYYPKACAEVVGLVRSGLASHGVRELPLSGYDFAMICERDRDVMFTQMKAFGASGQLPYAICATPEEAKAFVEGGGQGCAPMYWAEWTMKTMNRMCEQITWMALANQSDRDAMQEACLRSLEAWKGVAHGLDLRPMFSTVPPFNQATREVMEKYWVGELRAPNNTIYIL